MKYRYTHITASGTFDHFHVGHAAFLKKAFSISEHVSIGISTGNLLKQKKFPTQIQSFEARKEAVVQFLKQNKFFPRATLFTLADIYGIAKEERTLEGIIVTAETKKNAQIINTYRKENALTPLEVIQVDFVKSIDNKIVRSSRIRAGELKENGEVYAKLFSRLLELPKKLRKEMRQPLGTIVKGNEKEFSIAAQKAQKIIESMAPTLVITVGDIATQSLQEQHVSIDIAIIDCKTKRNEVVSSTKKEGLTNRTRNKAGTLSKKAVSVLHGSLQKVLHTGAKKQLVIQGEEDLLALPAILLSPLGSAIIYGQFDVGLVIVEVTQEVKNTVEKLIKQFT